MGKWMQLHEYSHEFVKYMTIWTTFQLRSNVLTSVKCFLKFGQLTHISFNRVSYEQSGDTRLATTASHFCSFATPIRRPDESGKISSLSTLYRRTPTTDRGLTQRAPIVRSPLRRNFDRGPRDSVIRHYLFRACASIVECDTLCHADDKRRCIFILSNDG